jgi:hypothetical protein
LAERFGGPNEAYSTEVAGRMQHGIASVSSVLSASASNTTRLELSAPTEAASPSAKILPNRLHKVFDQGVKQLVSQHQSVAFAKFPELRSYLKA